MERNGRQELSQPSFDGKDYRYHLHWELFGLHQQTHPVVGFCRSGELFGILGFGSVKTNVLKTLSGTVCKTSESAVTLFANGKETTSCWNRSTYLNPEDDNVLYGNLTVVETLSFSAELRVANPHDEISALRLLTAMELDHISEARISSLTAWQRRMILFATEIVAGQDLIFFDRPTLDLDATAALACVTALQRVARTGVLIAITSDHLSFREYAILDRVQLLTNVGSIFFGAGARAVSFFEQFGRTPSPGASIPDFLFYLVDDINSGFLDGGPIIKANIAQSKNICKHVDSYIKKAMNQKNDSGLFTLPANYKHFNSIKNPLAFMGHGHDDEESSETNVVMRYIIKSMKWIKECACLELDDEDMCRQPVVSRQFTWCLWRACSIRARNTNHFSGLLGMIGVMLPVGLVAVFIGSVSITSELGVLNYCLLLTIFPYCISLFGVIWNDDDVQDRLVVSFERSRSFYPISHFPIAAVVADVIVFKLLPIVLACVILIPLLRLQDSFMAIMRLLHALFLVTVVSTSLSKAVFNTISYNGTHNINSNENHHIKDSKVVEQTDGNSNQSGVISSTIARITPTVEDTTSSFNYVGGSLAAKAVLISVFWLTILLLFSGIFVCFGSGADSDLPLNPVQSLLSNLSMFRWVSDLCIFPADWLKPSSILYRCVEHCTGMN
jgi:ABC-type multidrug transport system ATPase subunit